MDRTAAPTFAKFPRLPSELRSHIISNNSNYTLAEYAQCSKLCNMDIQRYNTRPPYRIEFSYDETSATVDLFYKRRYRAKFTYALHFLKFGSSLQWGRSGVYRDSVIDVFDEEPYKIAIEYLKNRFKYVDNGECAHLEFHGNFYIPELLTISKIQKFTWMITFDPKMYQNFYESVRNERNDNIFLELNPQSFQIPVELFQTEFFQNLAHFECKEFLQGLQENEFLTMKAKKISIDCSTISDKAINQKIHQCAGDPAYQPLDYNFFRSEQPFDKNVILENFNTSEIHPTYTIIHHPTGSRTAFDSGSFKIQFVSLQWKRH